MRPSLPPLWGAVPAAWATVIGPDTLLRWKADPTAAKGSITLRGWDGKRSSAAACALAVVDH